MDLCLSRRLFSKMETCDTLQRTIFLWSTMKHSLLTVKKRWTIEEFHRGIKQTTCIEKCYSIKKRSQLTHIFACFVAFLKLEFKRLKTGTSWYEQKAQAVRLGISCAFA